MESAGCHGRQLKQVKRQKSGGGKRETEGERRERGGRRGLSVSPLDCPPSPNCPVELHCTGGIINGEFVVLQQRSANEGILRRREDDLYLLFVSVKNNPPAEDILGNDLTIRELIPLNEPELQIQQLIIAFSQTQVPLNPVSTTAETVATVSPRLSPTSTRGSKVSLTRPAIIAVSTCGRLCNQCG